ncbi:uncharacterized protein [Watersipora subatra]|uniref:uncharacterized protein n=1 Tax=Watersipora subatra TaxID=2589382 RepID=UPI00355BC65C
MSKDGSQASSKGTHAGDKDESQASSKGAHTGNKDESQAFSKETHAGDKVSKTKGEAKLEEVSTVKSLYTDKRDTLQKKPSSADLQSRLKSRKLLGVGVTDDGLDIHRSKVSQILGHNEPMLAASKEPIKWMLRWNGVLSALLMFAAFWSLVLPESYKSMVLGHASFPNVFYSTCLFSMSLPLISMSYRLVENSTQVLTLISVDITLIVHFAAAWLGDSLKPAIIIFVILVVNSSFLLLLYLESPGKLTNLFRKMSHPRESPSSTLDKKSK